MGMSGFGAAGQNYVNQRAGNEGAATQFLKLDGAFKQAIMMQKYKDLEEGRRTQFAADVQANEGNKNRSSAEGMNTQNNQTELMKAGMSSSNYVKTVETIMQKIAQGGFSVLNPGERALYDDFALKSAMEKLGIVMPGQQGRPPSTSPYGQPGGPGGGAAGTTLMKPKQVSEEDWLAATDEEKVALIKHFNR